VRQQYRQFRNTLGDKDGASGGYTYGETFVQQLELATLAYGGMFDVASIIRTETGAPMRWPTANDTTNTGRQLGESTAVTTTTDPTFGQVIWNSYKFSSDAILVPYELIRDSAFDLASELAQMLGIRLGRIQNTKYTTGTGANTAKGIVTCASSA
jgi:HK97 family phage major capsid protein